MMKLSDKAQKVEAILEDKQTRTNKELLIAAVGCTLIGLILGYVIGKATTNKNIIKKFNQRYTYDFGDEE